MRITDREVLGLVAGRFKTEAAAAAEFGFTPQTFLNWKKRGVPRNWRRMLWKLCKERGIHIDEKWIGYEKTAAERAALEHSLRTVRGAGTDNNGATNGEAGKVEVEAGKRNKRGQRPPARRPAAGRGVPAPPR